MKLGDIDNKPAPVLGIRFERVIKTEEGKLNMAARAYLHYIWSKLDLNIYIVTTGSARKAMAFCVKWAIPYTQVVEVKLEEIPLICMLKEFVYYYDLDRETLQNVRSRAGTTKAEFFERVDVAHGSVKRTSNNASRHGEIK